MYACIPACRFLFWLVCLSLACPPMASADEEELVRQYNGVVGALNGDRFDEAKQALDAFEKAASAVKAGDPAHKRAQELLKRIPELRLGIYNNSAIKSKNAADAAVAAIKLDEAAAHLARYAADAAELAKLRPKDKRYEQQQAEGKKLLAQVAIVQSLLAGKTPNAAHLEAAASEKPKQIYESAPGFALPRADRPQWVSPLSQPGQVVVIQIFQAADETALLAMQSARALEKQYGGRGVRLVSVSIDEGEALAKLDSFVSDQSPSWPVVLDDRGDFYERYMQGGYRLPAYVVVGRDRRAWWIGGAGPLETTAALAAKIHEEANVSANDLPVGPTDDFPPALSFSAAIAKDGTPATIAFGGKPALMVAVFEPRDGPHLAELAALAEKYAQSINMFAVVRSDKFAAVHDLASAHAVPIYQIRWGLPECFGANYRAKAVLVSRGGRVLKVAPLGDNAEHVRTVLERYAALLAAPAAYPAAADAPLSSNLVHRLAGGSIEQVSSAQEQGAEQRLNDGISGGKGWQPREKLPQEVTLSFLHQAPANVARLTIDRRAAAGRFEVLAGPSATGPFQSLGQFQADERVGRQAFTLPTTEARFLKLRFLSSLGERSAKLEIGEIEVEESADARPPLAERLAASLAGQAVKVAEDFNKPSLAFWEQTDFVFGLGNPEWRVDDGHLEPVGLPQIGELRATAILHASPAVADFRLQATVKSSGNQAGGIVFGFRDWDHQLRVVLVQGHVQTGRSEGNSIRLERWHEGRLEVLGVHGEPFPHGQPIRLEVLRKGTNLAVMAEEKPIFVLNDVPASPGRVGICAAGGGSFEVDQVQWAPLAANAAWTVPPLPPLSTAAGASLVWLNSQGDDRHPATWASHLLHNPVLAPAGAWVATKTGDELPEAVFAFRNHSAVTIEGLEFALPSAGADVKPGEIVERVDVLVAQDSPLDANGFRSVGQFSLQPTAGAQKFTLSAPSACRYLKLRLLANGGGERYALARFDVQLAGAPSAPSEAPAIGRQRIENDFQAPADDGESEPNDDLVQANPLRNGKSLEAAIHFGQTDVFRLPPPPTGKGAKTLRLTLDALPWLRLKAAVCDESGMPLDPPLAHFTAGQHAEQSRPARPNSRPPSLVRVEMPPASLALVLDTSGSMGGREEDVRAAVKSYLAGAAENERIEVIEFNSDVKTIGRLPESRQEVGDAVERLHVSGNTALYEALLAGMDENQAVVLLSDGMNTVFKTDFTQFCRRLGKRPAPIYVIGIGWDLHEYDANSGNTAYQLLQNLAQQTGGRFYFSPDSQQLTDLYKAISDDVRGQTRYRLRAEWEVSQRSVELAAIGHRSSGRLRAQSLSLPPGEPELAIGGVVRAGRGLKPAPVPPSGLDLAPMPRRGSAKAVTINLPASRELEVAMLPARRMSRPRAASLPLLVDVAVTYTPPNAGAPSLPPAVLPAFELIFDSSDSMKDPVTAPKIDVARKVMNELAETLPNHAQVGLRLYGHWGRWIARKTDPQGAQVGWEDPRLNTDSDLAVPIGPVNAKQRAELKRWINWTQPRGKTPMVYSLLEARKDFSSGWKGPRTVILVSDGVETCGGKLEDLAKAYQDAGIDTVIHVVGFDIAGTDAEKQLREIAKIGRGNYFPAQNAKQLGAALNAAAATGGYAVYDEADNLVGRGAVNGDSVPLLPGNYRVRLPQVKAADLKITVTIGAALRLKLNEDGRLSHP